MNKQEQIEELAKDLRLIKELQASDIYTTNYQEAVALISLGYRKIPEDAVVLTKKELVKTMESGYVYDTTRGNKINLIEMAREIERKETAKVILNVLYFNLQNGVKGHIAKSNVYYNVMSRIQQIAKNYGVEIEE